MSNSPAFDRLCAKLDAEPWHMKLRRSLFFKWLFLRIRLCGADFLISLDETGHSFIYARRPWLYRLLISRNIEVRKI